MNLTAGFSSSHAWSKWLMLAGVLVVIDQGLKLSISSATPFGFSYEVTHFFNIVHAHNSGAAFSFLASAGGWQRWFFLVVALAAAVFLGWLIRRGVASQVETIAYVAIIGGALGNAVDRARLGYVVDFLDFHLANWHWPSFNWADVCITTGAILLVATAFVQARHGKSQIAG